MIRAPSRSVQGLPNPNVGGAVECGQSVRCVQARCGGLLSDLEVGWNPWTSLVVRHSGTAARAVAGAGEATMAPLRCWSECSGVESRRQMPFRPSQRPRLVQSNSRDNVLCIVSTHSLSTVQYRTGTRYRRLRGEGFSARGVREAATSPPFLTTWGSVWGGASCSSPPHLPPF